MSTAVVEQSEEKIKKAPSTTTWRLWNDDDREKSPKRECSTPGCKTSAWSLRTTTIKRPTGAVLFRRHVFCQEHTPEDVV